MPPIKAAPFATTFDSLNFDDNIPNNLGGIFIPPDPHGAAGPNHVVSVVNASIQVHTKAGTPLFDSVAGNPITGVSLASFFAPLAPVNATFDPKVIYDQHADRFLVVTLERTGATSRILVAVSTTNDPTGAWLMTAINSVVMIGGDAHWADYPGFVVDEEAVYITNNMFSFAFGTFGGTRLWIIDKFGGGGGGFYGGAPAPVTINDPYGASPDCLTSVPFCGTSQPAHIFGAAPTTPNVGTWLSLFSGISSFGLEFMQVMRIDDPLGTPTFVGPSLVSMGNVDANTFIVLPNAPQMGTVEDIETNDRRALDSVWRDDSLYVSTTVNPAAGPDAGQATAHWVRLDTSAVAAGAVGLVDQGDIGGEDIDTGAHTFFPSIAVNSRGDIAVGFSVSGPNISPSSAYTTHGAFDAPGSNTGSTVLRAGLAPYIRTFDDPPCADPMNPAENRWGDYTATVLDPVDECFWIYNQHAIAVGTETGGDCNGRPVMEDGRWGTAFGRACLCNATFNLVADDWKQISIPCDPNPGGVTTFGDVFGDDSLGTYLTNWEIVVRDPVTPLNIRPALTDPIEIGKGYWIITDVNRTVAVNGNENPVVEFLLEGDPEDATGCGTSAGLCQIAGHPFNFDVCWADVEVVDALAGTTLSLAEADPAGACQGANAADNGCVMSRIASKWNGGAYEPFDGQTMGMEGTLIPWDGFWVSAAKVGAKLRVPATPGNCGAPARGPAITESEDGWFIRLIVESGDMRDTANVLGQLKDSVDDYDQHDLGELDPFGDTFLTAVFPHPEWGAHAGNYTSDYHAWRGELAADSWDFEVRANEVLTVTLSWEGMPERLARAVLVDVESGQQIPVKPGGSYVFTMTSTTHRFQWLLAEGGLIFEDDFETGDFNAWQ